MDKQTKWVLFADQGFSLKLCSSSLNLKQDLPFCRAAMATSVTNRGSSLLSFFIYNDSYGFREGTEGEKIMLYIPQEEEFDSQIKNVGLCEALIQFTNTFKPSKSCEVLHTQKSRQVFLNPEGRFFMALTVSIPYNQRILKDGKRAVEYFEEEVQDETLLAVLKQAYSMFRLFNGPFTGILKKSGLDILKEKLAYFYSRYLQTLNFGQFDILDIYHGVSFLPVDQSTFLRVQSFLNLVETSFPSVMHSSFLYNDQLLWTSLEQDDMRILFKYLTTSLFPATAENDLENKTGNQQNNPNPGRFLTASIETIEGLKGSAKRAPRLFISTNGELKEYYLVVYKSVNAIVCMLVNTQPFPTADFYLKLHAFIGAQLAHLSYKIYEQSSKIQVNQTDQQYRFLYFNQMNLAIKTTIHSKKAPPLTSVTSDMMKLIVDIRSDLNGMSGDREMIMKNLSDCWIVGRRSDKREFFVILNQKNASLVDINEEVKRLMSTSFNNVFFID